MHVLATTVEVLVVVCGHGPACEKAALDHIITVDPPSAKVQLKEVLTLICPNAAGLKQAFCAIIPQLGLCAKRSFCKSRTWKEGLDHLEWRKDAPCITS